MTPLQGTEFRLKTFIKSRWGEKMTLHQKARNMSMTKMASKLLFQKISEGYELLF